MTVEDRVFSALELAWEARDDPRDESPLPAVIAAAVTAILRTDSAPNRQFLLTIAAGTADDPATNPASLQLSAGVDRRGQAYQTRDALAAFKTDWGLTIKISKDAGVSNQWRETEIDESWVNRRRPNDQGWAQAFLTIVRWLSDGDNVERGRRAENLLLEVAQGIVEIAVGSALDYPRFKATPRLAMQLVLEFIRRAPDRPDATEAVVAVAARTLAAALLEHPSVERRDINSPDPIDVVLRSPGGGVAAGIEVTDEFISLAKLEHEVVPAMLKLGLDHATVVSRGIAPNESAAIDEFVTRAHTHFQQRIDLVTVDVIESWLSFPGADGSLSTDFLWAIGPELDRLSDNANRRAWFDVLDAYASSVIAG